MNQARLLALWLVWMMMAQSACRSTGGRSSDDAGNESPGEFEAGVEDDADDGGTALDLRDAEEAESSLDAEVADGEADVPDAHAVDADSSATSDAEARPVTTLAEFCAALAARTLEIRSACYPLRYPEATRAQALSGFVSRCMMGASILQPGVIEFDVNAARACLATNPIFACQMPLCTRVFVGKQGSGAPCKMASAIPAGEPNDYLIDQATGLGMATNCASGTACGGNSCTIATYGAIRHGPGGSCIPPEECDYGLVCLYGYKADAGLAGAICAQGSSAPGTSCHPNDDRCYGDSYCIEGGCRGPGRAGEACVLGRCEPGSYCVADPDGDGPAVASCAALKPNGAPCAHRRECGSATCESASSLCIAPLTSKLPGVDPE